jgi:arabinofuranosyltransferase
LPDSVHVVDRLGLADPLTARRLLDVRGRPGHEKTMPAAWTVARFAKPDPHEDGAVTAARRALACGPLASLERAVTGRLDLALFVDNVARAVGRAHLRIPADPFEAEQTYCGTPPLETTPARGGAGGAAFHVRCPDGAVVTGVRGRYAQGDRAVSRVQPVCGAPGGDPFDGAPAGDGAGDAFELECPVGSPVEGLRVSADNLVRTLGLVCRGDGGGAETAFAGASALAPMADACRPGCVVVGFVGRSGALVDAVGVECAE